MIDELRYHHPSMGCIITRAATQAAADEIERLRASFDPPICRLQFPDGSVPGNIFECAEGWKRRCDKLWPEVERLKQALADAHGLLISYGNTSDHFEDLKHDVELHFNAFRQNASASDRIETLARQLYEAYPKPPGPPDPPFGSPHFPKSEAEKYRTMAREQLSDSERPSEPESS